MLNTTLTVDEHDSDTHRGAGWAAFTDAIIAAVAGKESPVAFLLWGKHAQAKTRLIAEDGHVVVRSPHPMARLRQGFLRSKPFSRANTGLERLGARPIVWDLDG